MSVSTIKTTMTAYNTELDRFIISCDVLIKILEDVTVSRLDEVDFPLSQLTRFNNSLSKETSYLLRQTSIELDLFFRVYNSELSTFIKMVNLFSNTLKELKRDNDDLKILYKLQQFAQLGTKIDTTRLKRYISKVVDIKMYAQRMKFSTQTNKRKLVVKAR